MRRALLSVMGIALAGAAAATPVRAQELRGHNDLKTKLIYTHAPQGFGRSGRGVRGPADRGPRP